MDQKKPENDVYYSKCIEELKELKANKLKLNGLDFDVRIQSFIMDLPAKAYVTKTKQYNGEFGCITCDHPGESGTGNWIYPYTTEVNNKFKLNMGYQKIKFYILSV
jgi:hypothetical protein